MAVKIRRMDTLSIVGSFLKAIALTGLTVKSSRYIPRPIKWFIVFLLALNIRGFPLVWHFRHLSPWIAASLKHRFVAKTQGHQARLKRLTSISPLRLHPLDVVEVWKSRAGVADCDYNGHLSNSSYAKNLDFVRLNAAVRFFPGFSGHGVGGHVALAGTYHYFVKEITINTEYEILLYFGGWEGHKWVYLTAAFITRNKGRHKQDAKEGKKSSTPSTKPLEGIPTISSLALDRAESAEATDASIVIVPPVLEVTDISASTPASGIATPLNDASPEARAERSALETIHINLPEDATLHAVAVSQYCFKHGRMTVPPRVAFIASGFGDPARWERLMEIRKQTGGLKEMGRLMKGGWKDESWGDFWDFKDCEPRGRKAGDQLRRLRFVMSALAGEGR